MHEASRIQTGQQLRHLFATILLFCQPEKPEILWNNHKAALCEDIIYRDHELMQNQCEIEWEALNQLERYLLLNRKSLKDFPNMPLPPERIVEMFLY